MRKCKNCSYKLMPQDPEKCPQCGSTEILSETANPTEIGHKVTDDEMRTSLSLGPEKDGDIKDTQIGRKPYDANENAQESVKCMACGYPVKKIFSNCPNCNYQLGDPVHTMVEGQNNRTQSLSDIIKMGVGNDKVQLELSPLDIDDLPIKMKFVEGGQKVLGRADIDPDDESISLQNHVKFTFQGHNWSVENLSSNQAVFKMVIGAEDLKDGDVLILGRNKFYRVKIKK